MGPRLVLALGLAALGALAAHALYGFPRVGIDDANIVFTYARNLVAGDGLVYTPGHERVEGFSTPAWMLLSSAAFAWTPWPEGTLTVLSVLLCGITLFCVFEMVERMAAAPLRAARAAGEIAPAAWLPWLLALGWLGMLPAFAAWTTTTLMETALWAALVQLGALLIVLDATADRRRPTRVWGLGLTASLLPLTRPEGLVLGPLLVVLAVLGDAAGDRSARRALRRFAPAAALLLATLGGLLAFRLLYFGHPLPNAYYAKVSPDRLYAVADGARYLRKFALAQPVAALLALGVLGRAVHSGLRLARDGFGRRVAAAPGERALFPVCCWALAGFLLPLAEGGDHFAGHRFLQPFVPLLVAPWAAWAAQWRGKRVAAWLGPGGLALVSVGLAGLIAVSWWGFARRLTLEVEFYLAESGRRQGEGLNAVFPPDARPRVGTVTVGGVGFAYQGRVLDLMGINWVAMAHAPGLRRGVRGHSAFHPPTFWGSPPEILTMAFRDVPPPSACDVDNRIVINMLLRKITYTRRFQREYAPGYLETPQGVLIGYFLRSWASEEPSDALVLFPSRCPEQRSRGGPVDR